MVSTGKLEEFKRNNEAIEVVQSYNLLDFRIDKASGCAKEIQRITMSKKELGDPDKVVQ